MDMKDDEGGIFSLWNYENTNECNFKFRWNFCPITQFSTQKPVYEFNLMKSNPWIIGYSCL